MIPASTRTMTMEMVDKTVEQDVKEKIPFIPPNVAAICDADISSTYLSRVPQAVIDASTAGDECILGVDEAGRGPVLGSMVYGVSYCTKSYASSELAGFGFADSKTLTFETRSQLMAKICNQQSDEIGWGTRIMTARDISAGMLQPDSISICNLNQQAHNATIDLIRQCLQENINITEAYIDTVGPPESYQAKLSRLFPGIQITVSKKADSIYPIVSVASIVAKVTRDAVLESHRRLLSAQEWGSGYPSDPRTVSWLQDTCHDVFGWPSIVRFSWQTLTAIRARTNSARIEWPAEKQQFSMASFRTDRMPNCPPSTAWFGRPTMDVDF